MDRERLKTEIVPLLKTHGVRRAGLFGSAAKGQMRGDSDVDIVVDMPRDIGLLQFIGLKQQLEERLGRNVDLVEYQAIKPALKEKILHETFTLL